MPSWECGGGPKDFRNEIGFEILKASNVRIEAMLVPFSECNKGYETPG
jgi:hypothetical protein